MNSKSILPEWDLSTLSANPQIMLDEKYWDDLEVVCDQLFQEISELGEDMSYQQLTVWLEKQDQVICKAHNARVYAYLLFSQDTQKEGSASFYQTISEFVAQIDAAVGEMTAFLGKMSESYIKGAMTYVGLEAYQTFFGRLLAQRAHMLSPTEERQWVERAVTARDNWQRLAEESSSRVRVAIDGEDVPLDAAWNMLRDSDEDKRKSAYLGLVEAVSKEQFLMSYVYNAILKDCSLSNEWRDYDGVDDERHLANDTTAEWVDALRNVVRASYAQTSHKMNEIRLRVRGEKNLSMWNVTAPLVQTQSDVRFEQAFEWVRDAYQAFDPEMGDLVQKMRDEKRLDMALRPSKVGGAYCYPTPRSGAYVLCNYYGRMRDVLTLAHEIGHAIHSLLSQNLPAVTSSTSLVLSEIASLFSEKLCIDHILNQGVDVNLKKEVLSSYLQDQVGCIQGSINYDQFEKQMHMDRVAGEVSQEKLQYTWQQVRQEFVGPNVEVPQEYGVIWSVVPHFFHTPFYVYAYAFSALCMHKIYTLKDTDGFVEAYKGFLSAGGCMTFDKMRNHFQFSEGPSSFFQDAIKALCEDVQRLDVLLR